MKISRVIVIATVVAGCVFGLGWSAVTSPDRLAVRTKSAIDQQRWDELYEITKNPRGMVSPWGKATFVKFCRRYLDHSVKTEIKVLSEQVTANLSKMWVVLLYAPGSLQRTEILVYLNPRGTRWYREPVLYTPQWDLEAALAQEQLLNLAADIKFPSANGSEIATYEFLISEQEELLAMEMNAARTVRQGISPFSLKEYIASTRADLVQLGRESEVLKVERRYARPQRPIQ